MNISKLKLFIPYYGIWWAYKNRNTDLFKFEPSRVILDFCIFYGSGHIQGVAIAMILINLIDLVK